jgi:hypothetical protein
MFVHDHFFSIVVHFCMHGALVRLPLLFGAHTPRLFKLRRGVHTHGMS